ncbi:hypothetical protein D3C84_460180 [compost metagenome]
MASRPIVIQSLGNDLRKQTEVTRICFRNSLGQIDDDLPLDGFEGCNICQALQRNFTNFLSDMQGLTDPAGNLIIGLVKP